MAMFALGERLGKTLGEIGAIPYAELLGWIAYFEIKKEQRS
tara:strand:- start:154 stop:276 length:123 start_codon:yes stop_codon:yes gene_type:complete